MQHSDNEDWLSGWELQHELQSPRTQTNLKSQTQSPLQAYVTSLVSLERTLFRISKDTFAKRTVAGHCLAFSLCDPSRASHLNRQESSLSVESAEM